MAQIFIGPSIIGSLGFFLMQNVDSVITSFQQMTSIFVKHIPAEGNKFIVDVEM